MYQPAGFLVGKRKITILRRIGLALALGGLCTILVVMVPTGGEAARESTVVDLNLEKARELALSGNYDLRLTRLSLERCELALLELNEGLEELEKNRDELECWRDQLKEQEGQLQDQIEEQNQRADLDEDEAGIWQAYRALFQVRFELFKTETALEELESYLESFEEQVKVAREGLDKGREGLAFQKALLRFTVDSLYTGLLILEEQEALQKEALQQQEALLSNEQAKERAGYSSPLQVEEMASRVRQMCAMQETLEVQWAIMAGELLLTCGLSPEARLSVFAFTPPVSKPVTLEQALEEALNDGWLVQTKRQELNRRELDRQKNGSQMADLDCREAELRLRQAEGQTCAAVHRTYLKVCEKENQLARAEADLELGLQQKRTIQAQYEAGYITAAEAAAAPLVLHQKETDVRMSRYQLYLAGQEYDLARQGYVVPAAAQSANGAMDPSIFDGKD